MSDFTDQLTKFAYDQLNEGERIMVHYQCGTASHWETAFFKLCERSDSHNLDLLRNVGGLYAELVNAFSSYMKGDERWQIMRACLSLRDSAEAAP